MKRIYLEEDDFRELISGKIIMKEECELMLADIGYMNMLKIISKEMSK